MTSTEPTGNRVRARRLALQLTQADLAAAAGISRSAIAGIEGERLVPSVEAALKVASALGCAVEELFGNPKPAEADRHPVWAWGPPVPDARHWIAEVGGRMVRIPAESDGPTGWQIHDARETGAEDAGGRRRRREAAATGAPGSSDPARTLVVACCDPSAGLLARLYEQMTGFRMLVIPRSSLQSLDLLKAGLVHVAGTHLATSERPRQNADALRAKIAVPCRLLRVARWDEGVAVAPAAGGKGTSLRSLLSSRLRWIGREPGSGARQCMDERLPAIRARQTARDHRGVVESIRSGWADAGVCLRLPCDEAGLRFYPLRQEFFDFCFRADAELDPRLQGLLRVVRSAEYRRWLAEIPGFAAEQTGGLETVAS